MLQRELRVDAPPQGKFPYFLIPCLSYFHFVSTYTEGTTIINCGKTRESPWIDFHGNFALRAAEDRTGEGKVSKVPERASNRFQNRLSSFFQLALGQDKLFAMNFVDETRSVGFRNFPRRV